MHSDISQETERETERETEETLKRSFRKLLNVTTSPRSFPRVRKSSKVKPMSISRSASAQAKSVASDEQRITDLADRYQRLLQEHSRIKAQHSVLKSAVVKEQNEKLALSNGLKEKEQDERKSIQQLDLLTFHNERLTKRIESLQEALAAKKRGSWLSTNSNKKELEDAQSLLEVTSLDLEAKIEENARLHKELYKANGLYTEHVNRFQQQETELRKLAENLQTELDTESRLADETKAMLEREKKVLQRELGETREELQRVLSLMRENDAKLKRCDETCTELRDQLFAHVGLFDEILETVQEDFNSLTTSLLGEKFLSSDPVQRMRESAQNFVSLLRRTQDSTYPFSQEPHPLRSHGQDLIKAHADVAADLKAARAKIETAVREREEDMKRSQEEKERLTEDLTNLRNSLHRIGPNERAEAPIPKDTRSQGVQSDAEPVSNTDTLDEVAEPDLNETSRDVVDEESENVPVVSTNDSGGSGSEDVLEPTNSEIAKSTDLPDEGPPSGEIPTLQSPDPENRHNRPPPVVTMLSSPVRMSILRTEEPLPKEPPEAISRSKTSELPAEYARESLIKRHFEAKVSQYLDKIRLADGQALRFYQVWQQTKGQLRVSEKQRMEYQKETESLREQMESMQLNFQKQMDAMAEHVASLTLPTLRESEEAASTRRENGS